MTSTRAVCAPRVRVPTNVAITSLAFVALGACHRVPITDEEFAARVIMSTCPVGVAPAKRTDAPPNASLTVSLRIEPAVPAGTEVNLHLEGPFSRDNNRVDANAPARFDLPNGVYLVRASLPGYVSIEGRAPLTAGCDATMTLVMKKPQTR